MSFDATAETASTLASFSLGQGPREVVLLHGFLGSGRNLRTVAQRWLARDPNRRFFVPDLRGHGSSPTLSADVTMASLAQDVIQAIAQAGRAAPLSLVGHSLGGRVALVAAAQAPELFEEVVMLDIGPSPLAPERSESRKVLDVLLGAPARGPSREALRHHLMADGLTRPLADWLLMNLRADGDELVWRFDRQALSALHDRVSGEDLWPVMEVLARKEIPLHCVVGDRSSYVSGADVARMRALGCVVDTLPAGHFVHVDALDGLIDRLS